MTTIELKQELLKFLTPAYPNIKIEIVDKEDSIRSLYFTEEKFKLLYPKQRYHYLMHLIPDDFFVQNLTNTSWFELAPNENPDDLDYHDQETIDDITEPILDILRNKFPFISILDKEFYIENVKCFGDFNVSKKILTHLNFSVEDQFDIFHVLMSEGGYCDCEILFNVFRESEYAKKYWSKEYQ